MAFTTCPSADYFYRADARGMEIRFEGEEPAPAAPFLLPLSFRSVEAPKAKVSATPTPPLLTPTPTGGMIAPP